MLECQGTPAAHEVESAVSAVSGWDGDSAACVMLLLQHKGNGTSGSFNGSAEAAQELGHRVLTQPWDSIAYN